MKSLAKILLVGVPAGLIVHALPWNYGVLLVIAVLWACCKAL